MEGTSLTHLLSFAELCQRNEKLALRDKTAFRDYLLSQQDITSNFSIGEITQGIQGLMIVYNFTYLKISFEFFSKYFSHAPEKIFCEIMVANLPPTLEMKENPFTVRTQEKAVKFLRMCAEAAGRQT